MAAIFGYIASFPDYILQFAIGQERSTILKLEVPSSYVVKVRPGIFNAVDHVHQWHKVGCEPDTLSNQIAIDLVALVPKPLLMLVILLASVSSCFSVTFVLPPFTLKPVRLPLSKKRRSESANDAKDGDSDGRPQLSVHIGMLSHMPRRPRLLAVDAPVPPSRTPVFE